MTTKIRYVYNSYLESCGCCSNSESYIEMWTAEGRGWEEHDCYAFCSDEEELREYLKEAFPALEDYEIVDDCEWF